MASSLFGPLSSGRDPSAATWFGGGGLGLGLGLGLEMGLGLGLGQCYGSNLLLRLAHGDPLRARTVARLHDLGRGRARVRVWVGLGLGFASGP